LLLPPHLHFLPSVADLLLFVCLFVANDHRHSLSGYEISDEVALGIDKALKTNSKLTTLK